VVQCLGAAAGQRQQTREEGVTFLAQRLLNREPPGGFDGDR
jgi:hypothetical protein